MAGKEDLRCRREAVNCGVSCGRSTFRKLSSFSAAGNNLASCCGGRGGVGRFCEKVFSPVLSCTLFTRFFATCWDKGS